MCVTAYTLALPFSCSAIGLHIAVIIWKLNRVVCFLLSQFVTLKMGSKPISHLVRSLKQAGETAEKVYLKISWVFVLLPCCVFPDPKDLCCSDLLIFLYTYIYFKKTYITFIFFCLSGNLKQSIPQRKCAFLSPQQCREDILYTCLYFLATKEWSPQY